MLSGGLLSACGVGLDMGLLFLRFRECFREGGGDECFEGGSFENREEFELVMEVVGKCDVDVLHCLASVVWFVCCCLLLFVCVCAGVVWRGCCCWFV